MLRVQGLGYVRGRHGQVLRDISFELGAGEILSILGPNGAGKTTLLKCVLGLNKSSGGTITYNHRPLQALSARERAKIIAYVPQFSSLAFPYSVREVVLMGRLARLQTGGAPGREDEREAMRALTQLDIAALADKPWQALSGGEKQLAIFARALAQNARILIMDEPTSALDFANQARTLALVKRLAAAGYSVLMTTHSPDHALWIAHRVLMLKNGGVFAAGRAESVISSASLSHLYGVETLVSSVASGDSGGVRVCLPLLAGANRSESAERE